MVLMISFPLFLVEVSRFPLQQMFQMTVQIKYNNK